MVPIMERTSLMNRACPLVFLFDYGPMGHVLRRSIVAVKSDIRVDRICWIHVGSPWSLQTICKPGGG